MDTTVLPPEILERSQGSCRWFDLVCDTVRQRVSIQQGSSSEKAKEIARFIRDTKLKVKNTIQEDSVRVSGRDRDTLQKVMSLLREKDFGIDMQFTNYRTH